MTTTAPSAARFIGSSVKRREDRRMLTGHGRYIDDIVVPGMLHAAFVRSDLARGLITGLNVEAARGLDGVRAVYTAADLNAGQHEYWQTMVGRDVPYPPFRALADGDVRYVGEPIAIVVAESRYLAEDACELVEVDYDPLPPVLDPETALDDTDNVVHPELGTNVASEIPPMPDPELEAIFDSAAHVFEETFSQHRHLQVPMEARGLVAHWDPGAETLRIWASTQSPHEYRAFFARYLAIPETCIRVTMEDVGGGFGQKVFAMREDMAVVLATRKLGRPVKWVEDRRENLVAASSARAESMRVKMAVDDAGLVRAVIVDHVEDVGAYPVPGPGSSATFTAMMFTGPYKIPRLGFRNRAAYTNTTGRAAYRGPWMMETVGREMMMDVVARELGLDPVEFRLRNVVRAEDLPYTTPSMLVYDSVTPHETLMQAAELIDYDAFRAEQTRARAEGRYFGLGVSVYIEPSSMAFGIMSQEVATVRVDSGGKVHLIMGTASHGQSLETTMPQIVADQLGVDIDDVVFIQGDTDVAPYNTGTGGSRSAVYSGSAAREASLRVRDKAIEIVAHAMEAAPEDFEMSGGEIAVRGAPTRSMTLAQAAELAYIGTDLLPPGMEPGLEATARYKGPPFTWSNAAHLCTVEVDVDTGQVTILRYVVSEDCGVMINPMVVDGQIDGGVVQGIGGVLYEHMVYDEDGNPLTTTFLDYLLPTAAEVPEIEHGHIETPAPGNPGGYKGMGEGGAIGAPAAVVNAVADALAPLGVRITSQPLGPNEVFALIDAAEADGRAALS
jgi:aerobic carbon-monoxide dehydrogenase large subunit